MDWTVLAVAVVAAAGGLTATIAQWRLHRAQGHSTEIDAQGEIIKDLHDHIEWQRNERRAMGEKLDQLNDEMHPNGGQSLRDAVDRIEQRVTHIEQQLEAA